MPSKKGSQFSVCLKKDGNISFDPGTNAGIFKVFYSNLASDLINQLPTATSKYDMNYVRDYYNNMPGAVGCEMVLYADDTCLVFQDKDLDTLSDRLNTEFNQLCDWFVDNKLSIHFGENKTKSILFTGKTSQGQYF